MAGRHKQGRTRPRWIIIARNEAEVSLRGVIAPTRSASRRRNIAPVP
jgi:hypothetical protein